MQTEGWGATQSTHQSQGNIGEHNGREHTTHTDTHTHTHTHTHTQRSYSWWESAL